MANRIVRLLAPIALLCALAAPIHAQTVTSVAPARLGRDATTQVVVRGTGLATLSAATISGGDLVVSRVAASDTVASFDVGVGANVALGARSVTLSFSDAPDIELPSAVEVVPGPLRVLSLTPNAAARGAEVQLAVVGSNLDTVAAWSFGDAIEVVRFAHSSPTRGTVTVRVGSAAFAGPRSVTASRADGSFELPAGFSVTGGASALTRVTPASVVRGASAELVLEGANLDAVESVSFGARVPVSGFVVDSPTRARVTVSVLEDAVAGPREVSLRRGAETIPAPGAFTVTRGPVAVIAIRPDRLSQRDVTFLTIDGSNLDGMTAFDAGPGIRVTAITATLATSASVDVEVADDAPVGFRDVVVTAPAGAVTANDALVVTEYVPPVLNIRVPPEATVGDTQVGAYRRGGFELENLGVQAETLTIVGTDGDTDLFALLDEHGRRTNRLTRELGVGEVVTIPVEFAPELRGRSGAQYSVTARGGADAGTVVLRSNGIRQELEWSLEMPFDTGVLPAGERVNLPRLDTLLRDGVPARQVLITGWRLRATRDGEPEALPDLFTVDFQSTIETGELFWGATELLWTIQGEAAHYEGELILETDSSSAPLVPFRFFAELEGDGPADPGPDAGDVGDTDAGSDAGDAGSDTDTGRPDGGLDVGPDTDDAGTDAPGDASDDAGSDAGGGGGGGGCCAISGRASAMPSALLALLALALSRRRRAA